MKLINCFFMLVFATLSIRCNDDPVSTEDAAEIKYIPTYEDVDDIFQHANGKMTKENEFVSFESKYTEVLGKFSEAETESEQIDLLEKYKDIVSVSNDAYEPAISNTVYRMIANRDRLYIVGDRLCKVMDNEVIVTTDKGNLGLLKELQSIAGIDKSMFDVVNYNLSSVNIDSHGRMNASCGAAVSQDYFDNPSGCRNDRRVWVRGRAFYVVGASNERTPSVTIEVYGELRSGTSCRWRGYSTQLNSRNTSFVVSTNGLVANSLSADIANRIQQGETDGDQFNYFVFNGPVLPPIRGLVSNPFIEFSRIHLEGSSRGVSGNWAVLDCQ